jgi:signal transduction histidine kinase
MDATKTARSIDPLDATIAAHTQEFCARPATRRFPIAAAILSASVIGLTFSEPVHAFSPQLRAGIETAITLAALRGAYLMLIAFSRRRRLRDMLLLGAFVALSVMQLAFGALPALTAHTAALGASERLACEMLVAIAFAAAAFARDRSVVGLGRRTVALALAAPIGSFALIRLLAWTGGWHVARGHIPSAAAVTASDVSVVLAIPVIASCVLMLAGLGFVARSRSTDMNAGLLASACFLLAAAELQFFALPGAAAGWVTPGTGLRAAAFAMLLAVAGRQVGRLRREEQWWALSTERERIAHDLHDGIVQDLAVIAAYGQNLASTFGSEHPMMIATRRILAASRGVIEELTTSTAATAYEALCQMADELAARFDADVRVRIKHAGARVGAEDLDPTEREAVVRIAREAIVNAIRHGGAHRIDVELDYDGPALLRVIDDGCGIGDEGVPAKTGFGVRAMRARAKTLGGRLVARPGADGGTELEVVIP